VSDNFQSNPKTKNSLTKSLSASPKSLQKTQKKNIDLEKQTKHFGEKLIKSHKYVKHLRTNRWIFKEESAIKAL
jgi:hypothetical protein